VETLLGNITLLEAMKTTRERKKFRLLSMKLKIYSYITAFAAIVFLFSGLCSCAIDSSKQEASGNSNSAQSDEKSATANSAPTSAGNSSIANKNYSSNAQVSVFSAKDRLIVILQCAGFTQLYRADFDIAVIDCDDSTLTKKEIADLKNQGKSIISYLSIGEAEIYRSYWQSGWKTGNPQFIEEENPNWPGNFKVKFWDLDWQEIIFSMLEEIVLKGYDGVYLDVVDAYEYFEQKGFNLSEYYMIEFIKDISTRAKALNPKFLIIPQNAEGLAGNGAFLNSIDGFGRENLWFENNVRVKEEESASALKDLLYAKENGKFVFSIDYSITDDLKNEFLSLCASHGFIPFAGTIELDSIEK
jgi:uncharacterized protein (TIGR01370 family)